MQFGVSRRGFYTDWIVTLSFPWLYAQGLDLRPILNGHHTFEVVQPSKLTDPTEFIQDNSIVLTTGIAFESNPEGFRRYAHDVHGAGAVGIGFGTGLIFDTIPQPLIDAVRDLGLALFEVPRHIPFASILNVVHGELSRRERLEQERVLDIQEQLNKVAIKGGLDDMLTVISRYLRAAVAIVDSDGRLISSVNYHDLSATDVARGLAESGCKQSSAATVDGSYQIVHRMSAQGDRHHLMVVVSAEVFSAHARSIIKHCAGLADILLQHPANLRKTRADLNSLAVSLLLGLDTHKEAIDAVFASATDAHGRIRPVVVHGAKKQLRRVLATVDTKLAETNRNLFALSLSDEILLLLFRGSRSVDRILRYFEPTSAQMCIAIGIPMPERDLTLEKSRNGCDCQNTVPWRASQCRLQPEMAKRPHVRRSLDARAGETY